MLRPILWEILLKKKYDLATQMINNGANINEPANIICGGLGSVIEMSLLHYAVVKTSDAELIRVLVNLGANINARDSYNNTPLHWAADCHPDRLNGVVEVLINEGAIVDARANKQFTPLHYLAGRPEIPIETAQKLIARGASIDGIGINGCYSVLHVAVLYDNLEMVKLLISHRVNIDVKDKYGRTPLLYYLRNRKTNLEIFELLLENGADVNSEWRGITALHLACMDGLADVTAVLLKFGADLNARNQEGLTPFELLTNNSSSEATAKVIIREAVKREALGQYLCEGYKQMVQSCESYSKFDQECREEVERMKSEKIDIEDSAVSFFYIFSVNEEKLLALARNEKIITAFESSGYVASFRIYAREFTERRTKCEVAKKCANFLMHVEDFLGDVLNDMLSEPVVQKIATYVKYGEIHDLI